MALSCLSLISIDFLSIESTTPTHTTARHKEYRETCRGAFFSEPSNTCLRRCNTMQRTARGGGGSSAFNDKNRKCGQWIVTSRARSCQERCSYRVRARATPLREAATRLMLDGFKWNYAYVQLEGVRMLVWHLILDAIAARTGKCDFVSRHSRWHWSGVEPSQSELRPEFVSRDSKNASDKSTFGSWLRAGLSE